MLGRGLTAMDKINELLEQTYRSKLKRKAVQIASVPDRNHIFV